MCLVTEQIIKPKDCLLAVAIPLSKGSRYKNLRVSANAQFAKHMHWGLYEQDTLLPFRHLLPLLKKLKVGMKPEFCLADLQYHLSHNDYKVIILVAHWTDTAIELFDSLMHQATPELGLCFIKASLNSSRILT